MVHDNHRRRGRGPVAGWLVVAAFAIPAVIGALSAPTIKAENRLFAQWPGLPRTVEAMFAWPAKVSDYVNDQFGLRDPLIRLNNRLRFELFAESAKKDILLGRDDWLFRSADGENAPLDGMLLRACGKGSPLWSTDYQADVIDRMLSATLARGFDARLLIVPSASNVYRDHLPAWFGDYCGGSYPIQQVVTSPLLDEANRTRVLYPLQRMQHERAQYEVYPRSNFHWDGEAVRRQAAELAQAYGRPAGTPLITSVIDKVPENIGEALIGVPSPRNRVLEPDLVASGIEGCTGGAGCFGSVEDIAARLMIVSHYTNPKAAPGKLVIISDSFGPYLSRWMTPYYREVVQLATNTIRSLSAEDMQRLASFVFSEEGGDVLFLYNELNVSEVLLATNVETFLPFITSPSKGGRDDRHLPIGFYPTNAEWVFGFARGRPMFLTRNGDAARTRYVPGALLTFRDGEQRRITEAVSLGDYLHVYYEGAIVDGNRAGPPDRVTVSPP